MKTYKETLDHIFVNKHQYSVKDVFATQRNLDTKLEVVSYIYNIPFVDVINDYSDLKSS